ncbi:GNAT family N-acetyltransferase [Sphingomonas canadensis]|uniref:GNAT family N-acetyltransferase n=1 Tax=Sphingomonas canadensis TaxID=1219257 RepID=A0ABW3HAU5_9SPHN|nr:GNAT family N-acetyltransferase [Sphingomonas canadensis]MCW3837517.1 GNAT family N-acetyltransferase [Sphingomonas canadensis]
MTGHPLDRPAWSALTGRQSPLAEGGPLAVRMRRDHGLFGAAADGSAASQAALAALMPEEGELWLVESGPVPPLPGTVVARAAMLHQMTLAELTPAPPPAFAIAPLGEGDAAEMFALAMLTRPGPYAACTHRLGDFHGVRVDGRLVAMAGERLKPAGFTEVSGVCTHPDWRGRGYAGALMRRVIAGILARGETPFLHSYASNAGAIALYESLGFRFRAEILATVLVRG